MHSFTFTILFILKFMLTFTCFNCHDYRFLSVVKLFYHQYSIGIHSNIGYAHLLYVLVQHFPYVATYLILYATYGRYRKSDNNQLFPSFPFFCLGFSCLQFDKTRSLPQYFCFVQSLQFVFITIPFVVSEVLLLAQLHNS